MTTGLDLVALRRELEERRDTTRARVERLARRPERGSALGFGKRIGDGTIEAVSRLTDIGVGGSLEASLARTERALAKLDDGDLRHLRRLRRADRARAAAGHARRDPVPRLRGVAAAGRAAPPPLTAPTAGR